MNNRSPYPAPFSFGLTKSEACKPYQTRMVQATPCPPVDFPGRVTVWEGNYEGGGAHSSEIGRGQQLPMTIPDWPVQNPNPFGSIDSEKK